MADDIFRELVDTATRVYGEPRTFSPGPHKQPTGDGGYRMSQSAVWFIPTNRGFRLDDMGNRFWEMAIWKQGTDTTADIRLVVKQRDGISPDIAIAAIQLAWGPPVP